MARIGLEPDAVSGARLHCGLRFSHWRERTASQRSMRIKHCTICSARRVLSFPRRRPLHPDAATPTSSNRSPRVRGTPCGCGVRVGGSRSQLAAQYYSRPGITQFECRIAMLVPRLERTRRQGSSKRLHVRCREHHLELVRLLSGSRDGTGAQGSYCARFADHTLAAARK